ncbi:MAG TPA: DUF6178 family protein [Vicinamibacterales bacterium]|nr:DUF6178 family protein [Vicinamibacterales bacterium]
MVETRDLVKRLLDTPDIARVLPRLPPDVLHRLIDRCGLEACAEIVALITPRQLERLLDIDLWRAPAPGADERLDAERFGQWVEMLLQLDPSAAAERLAAMDLDLVVGALAEHVAVFDGAVITSFMTLDGEQAPGRALDGQVSEIGGFFVQARRSPAWDAILELLVRLQDERPALFHRVMRGCIGLSDGAREADGFHPLLEPRDQHRSDLASERAVRRDAQGYVAPAEARAFLQASRRIRLEDAQPPADPIVRACLRAIAPEPVPAEEARADEGSPGASTTAAADAAAVTSVFEILSGAGVLTQPRALIGAGDADDSRLSLVRQFGDTHLAASEELAFLANALLAGGAIQGRPFAAQQAADAVLATCNLGFENWPAGWPVRDLVAAFQVGWAVLDRDLCRHGAAVLIDVLADLECSDRDVHWALQTLRRDLMRHLRDGEPWRAREALDAILMLDAPAWAVLRALIDECPTLHATLDSSRRQPLRVDPAACTFVARNREIGAAREYLASLSSTLAG